MRNENEIQALNRAQHPEHLIQKIAFSRFISGSFLVKWGGNKKVNYFLVIYFINPYL